MANETREELEGLAAEFVLGTLTASERADATFRMRTDPDFKRAVEGWDKRLAPLLTAVPAVEPPAGLEERILQRIVERREAPDGVIGLQRQLRRWQRFSLASAAVAAALVILLFGTLPRQIGHSPSADRYVAVLQAEGEVPAFLVSIDLERAEIQARRIGAQPQAGKSFELWAVGAGGDKPLSLGIVEDVLDVPASRLGAGGRNPEDLVFAISAEPEGGSPTGEATGPILFTGKPIAAP
jgi:anti-sigma-K factor RskA